MTSPVLFHLDENTVLGKKIHKQLGCEMGKWELRNFPDGETYLRILSQVEDKTIVLVASLNQPDEKILRLLFFSQALRESGAKKIVLVAPYLAYMRQDKAFHEGEVITSRYFARIICQYFDALVTVDPHLHRYHALSEIYTIPCRVVHAASSMAAWIRAHVPQALLIGPDSESQQWVREVAQQAAVPYTILEKIRHGDEKVQVSIPQIEEWKDRSAVLVDDIISTGHTMLESIQQLKKLGVKRIYCIGVHAIFAGEAYNLFLKSGIEQVLTCNAIEHSSNKIDLSPEIAKSLGKLFGS
ncbi:MAG: ribose-phosphate pyrophosphokinase [Deltaproteobacteria bacterium]|nr:ribose-phosphate pyrophosphokinase [Deltaproteobacteria bacterium]